jgi:hypothetical protein
MPAPAIGAALLELRRLRDVLHRDRAAGAP